MQDDSEDWRWIDEHIERPTPEIATDAVLAQPGEGGISQKQEVDVVVTVSGEHRERIEYVTDGLRAAGLEVARVQEEIGQITGTVQEDRLDALRTVAGVQSVERTGKGPAAPPGSPVQ